VLQLQGTLGRAALSDAKKLAAELAELERSQLANELHDGVMPLLFVASSTIGNLREKLLLQRDNSSRASDTDLHTGLDQVAGWLQEAMDASRRLLTETYPPDLEASQWHVAVADTLERLFPQWIDRVVWELEPEIGRICHASACAAYRIVLEAVRNAFQHGDAKEVVISGSKVDGLISVVIRDNGSGFDPECVPASRFGIRAMRGRARLLAGQFEIDSTLGGPTTVMLTLPMGDVSGG